MLCSFIFVDIDLCLKAVDDVGGDVEFEVE